MRKAVGHTPSKRRKWAIRIVLATVVAAVLAYLPYKLLDGSGAQKTKALGTQLRRLSVEIDKVDAENAQLRRDIHALRTDQAAIEDVARDELQMVYPDEIVIRIDDEVSP